MFGRTTTTKNEPTDDEVGMEPPPFQASNADKEATRKRKALFLRQVLVIADRFSRNPVSFTMLASAIPWLEREQYDNIAVERNANGNCGYILCPNPLGDQISQVYRINSNTRRVFDLTHRKHFCSDWCYSASCYVRKQIPTEPGWCRPHGGKGAVNLTLLPKHARSSPGKLVLDGLRRLHVSVQDEPFDNESDTDQSDSKASSVSDPSESDVVSSYSSDSSGVSNPPSPLSDGDAQERRLISKKSKTSRAETSWGVRIEVPKHNLVIEHSPLPNSSETSVSQLHTPQPDYHEQLASQTVCPSLFTAVRVRLLQWITSKAFRVLTGSKVPLPNESVEAVSPTALSNEASSSPPPGVLPLLESVSVDTMRRHLLMEELIPSVNAILSKMHIPSQPTLSLLENAVTHFRLTNRNLHMSRVQRSLISLAILRLMAPSNSHLAPLTDAQLASILEMMTTESREDFLNNVIHPVYKHFDET